MADSDTFDVIVMRFEPGDEPPATRLYRVFGIEAQAADRLLQRLPAPVQRGVPRIRAEYYRRALLKIGATVEVRDANGELIDALVEGSAASDSTPPRASQLPPSSGGPLVFTDAAWDEGTAWSASASAIDPPGMPPISMGQTPTARLDGGNRGTADTLIDKRPRAASPSAPEHAPVAQEAWPNLASTQEITVVDAQPPVHEVGPEAMRAPANPTWIDGDARARPMPLAAPSTAPLPRRANATALHAVAAKPVDDPRDKSPIRDSFRPPPLDLGASASDDISLLSRMPSAVWDAAPPAKANDSWDDPATPKGYDAGALDLPFLANLDPAARAGVPRDAAHRRPPRELSQPSALGENDPARAPLTLDHALGPMSGDQPVTKWERDDSMTDPVPPNDRRSPMPPLSRSSRPSPGGPARSLDARPFDPADSARAVFNSDVPVYSEDSTAYSENGSAGPAPLDLPSQAPARPANARAGAGRAVPGDRAQAPDPARKAPRKPASARREPAREPARRDPRRAQAERATPAPAADTRTFWQSLRDASSLPFSGPGKRWIGVIVGWALVAALLSMVALSIPLLGAVFAFFAYGSLLAVACDYFRACFWIAPVGASRLDRAPALDVERILHGYVKAGIHVSLMALTTGLPLIIWIIQALGEGATPVALMSEPVTWLLALLPGSLWPAFIAMSALRNSLSAVWNVPQALTAICRAPREYAAVVAIGAAIFGIGMWMMLFLGDALGLTGALLTATFGAPLALSHGVMGVLMGHLTRVRPEAFG